MKGASNWSPQVKLPSKSPALLGLTIVLINTIENLMISAKLATPDHLKIRSFEIGFWCHNLCPWNHQQNFITLIKLYCRYGYVVMVMHFYKKSYPNFNYISILPEKPNFWGVALVQVQYFGTGTRYGLEILLRYEKSVETKSQKVLRANSYFWRSCREKTGRCTFLKTLLPPP